MLEVFLLGQGRVTRAQVTGKHGVLLWVLLLVCLVLAVFVVVVVWVSLWGNVSSSMSWTWIMKVKWLIDKCPSFGAIFLTHSCCPELGLWEQSPNWLEGQCGCAVQGLNWRLVSSVWCLLNKSLKLSFLRVSLHIFHYKGTGAAVLSINQARESFQNHSFSPRAKFTSRNSLSGLLGCGSWDKNRDKVQ